MVEEGELSIEAIERPADKPAEGSKSTQRGGVTNAFSSSGFVYGVKVP